MPLNTIPNKGLTSRGYPSDRLVTPIIINGDMSVAQRGTSATGLTGVAYNTVDRWQTSITNQGTWTQSQSTDVPTGQGFAKSLKMDCTTADASPASGDSVFIRSKFEGQNLQMLKKGTSNAESLTLSFWVKSNKTGTYIAELYDVDNARQISKAYTISSASTWEKKTLTFEGDNTGAFGNDNGLSLQLAFWLGSGSDYNSGTLSTSWTSATQANRAVGNVNLADSTSNEWYITGVQLEVGEFDSTTLPSFPFESYESNLRKCQRYLQKFTTSDSSYNVFGTGIKTTSSAAEIPVPLKTTMRAKPSVSSSGLRYRDTTAIDSSITIGGSFADRDFPMLQITNISPSDVAGYLQGDGGSDFLQFDAEL